ncbi:hypothetical protein NFI08_20925 [Halomonas sp. EF61]|uniref:hypothetical protein n=1 Tax=Halomonas sp. EF61 TaxID=2950869 RepID=UPI0032DE3837
MLNETLKRRLAKDRPTTTVTLRVPVDVVESLKAIAPRKGLQGYQTLLKAYVSEGLRRDEARYLDDGVRRLVEALKARGVAPELIERAVADANEEN